MHSGSRLTVYVRRQRIRVLRMAATDRGDVKGARQSQCPEILYNMRVVYFVFSSVVLACHWAVTSLSGRIIGGNR